MEQDCSTQGAKRSRLDQEMDSAEGLKVYINRNNIVLEQISSGLKATIECVKSLQADIQEAKRITIAVDNNVKTCIQEGNLIQREILSLGTTKNHLSINANNAPGPYAALQP